MYQRVGQYPGALKPLIDAIVYPANVSGEGYRTIHDGWVQSVYEPYLKEWLPGQWVRCFLSIIWHNGFIEPHVDTDMQEGTNRVHVVFQTNPYCWYLHDQQWQQLEAGGIYTIDPSKPHASINWGHQERIHFVLDRLTILS